MSDDNILCLTKKRHLEIQKGNIYCLTNNQALINQNYPNTIILAKHQPDAIEITIEISSGCQIVYFENTGNSPVLKDFNDSNDPRPKYVTMKLENRYCLYSYQQCKLYLPHRKKGSDKTSLDTVQINFATSYKIYLELL